MATIVGRIKEQEQLKALQKTNISNFVAVYGRRRVGKTFLIRESFKEKFAFQYAGMANVGIKQQLIGFQAALSKYSKSKKQIPLADSWFSAFQQLIVLLEKNNDKKKVVFIDELPWLDTPKSNFVSALEHFWNSWASARKDVLLIVCGSAASWMIHKLINNKGGLHNRITHKIKIAPFTLAECEAFLKHKRIHWNRHQIIENYMVMGGIPFYLNAIKPGQSAAQSINELYFSENGLLVDEFANLYASLFKHSANHIAVVETLSKKAKGITRDIIVKQAKLPNGGGLTKVLDELETSGFIRKYIPYGKKSKDSIYQLVDFYTLFYFKFIKDKKYNNKNYWLNILDTPTHRTWSGYAFEQVCLMHIDQLQKELGISGIQSNVSVWRSKANTDGAQIDLLIERKDQIINLCEVKFSIAEFTIDKKYAASLRHKMSAFKTESKTKSALHLTMITTYGITANEHASGLVQSSITMDNFFITP